MNTLRKKGRILNAEAGHRASLYISVQAVKKNLAATSGQTKGSSDKHSCALSGSNNKNTHVAPEKRMKMVMSGGPIALAASPSLATQPTNIPNAAAVNASRVRTPRNFASLPITIPSKERQAGTR